jgi:hypothetical protein
VHHLVRYPLLARHKKRSSCSSLNEADVSTANFYFFLILVITASLLWNAMMRVLYPVQSQDRGTNQTMGHGPMGEGSFWVGTFWHARPSSRKRLVLNSMFPFLFLFFLLCHHFCFLVSQVVIRVDVPIQRVDMMRTSQGTILARRTTV